MLQIVSCCHHWSCWISFDTWASMITEHTLSDMLFWWVLWILNWLLLSCCIVSLWIDCRSQHFTPVFVPSLIRHCPNSMEQHHSAIMQLKSYSECHMLGCLLFVQSTLSAAQHSDTAARVTVCPDHSLLLVPSSQLFLFSVNSLKSSKVLMHLQLLSFCSHFMHFAVVGLFLRL